MWEPRQNGGNERNFYEEIIQIHLQKGPVEHEYSFGFLSELLEDALVCWMWSYEIRPKFRNVRKRLPFAENIFLIFRICTANTLTKESNMHVESTVVEQF